MAVINNRVQIDQPPEVVFDYLSDIRNELEWNPDIELVQKLTDGPIGVGTRFLAKWKQSQQVVVECTQFERPREWSYVNGGKIAAILKAKVTPQRSGSLLTISFEAQPIGFTRLVFPLLLQALKRTEKRNMGYIKSALEDKQQLPAASPAEE